MSTYAIGDLQGSYVAISRLLDAINFDPAGDRLWFCGDLVNRGGESLATLRLVRSLDASCVAVLGNHDLHFLAQAHRSRVERDDNEELEEVLSAHDAQALIDWLGRRPVLHVDVELGFALVHAGIHPAWTRDQAIGLAAELESCLRGPERSEFFLQMYGKKPKRWSESLTGYDRLRLITNILTRMRYCRADGKLKLGSKGPPGTQPAGIYPWFEVPGRCRWQETIVFGHWSALGFHHGEGVIGLDTGFVWGGSLTAIDLEDPARVFQVRADSP